MSANFTGVTEKIVEHLIISLMLTFFSMTDARTNFKNILDKSL